jgi:hypothetical protein
VNILFAISCVIFFCVGFFIVRVKIAEPSSPEKQPEIKIQKSCEYTLERFDFPNAYLIRITNTKTGESYISCPNSQLVKETR